VAGKQLPFEVVLRVDGVVTFQVSLDIPGLHIVATTNLVASRQQDLNVIHRVESSALFQVDELISLGLLQVSSQSIEEQRLPGPSWRLEMLLSWLRWQVTILKRQALDF